MKIGVWIELPPRSQLVAEGIGQLLRYFIEGTGPECTFVFLVPVWLRRTVRDYLDTYEDQDRERIRVRYSRKLLPLTLVLLRKQALQQEEETRLQRAVRAAKLRIARSLAWLASLSTPSAVGLAIIALPLLPVVLLLLGFGWVVQRHRGYADRAVDAVPRLLLRMKDRYISWALPALMDRESDLMARKARKESVDLWFVPNPGWSGAAKLRKPLVSLFPDYVFAEYPAGFSDDGIRLAERRFLDLVASRPHYICFSENVRTAHAIAHLSVPRQRIHLVQHAPVDLRRHLKRYSGNGDGFDYARAQREFSEYLGREQFRAAAPIWLEQIEPFVRSLPIAEARYLFISSQNRPYKNILSVVKAVRVLVRELQCPVKLLMTGSLEYEDPADEVAAYVLRECLQLDVISIPRVPNHIHALLYKFALLTIHPSLFEGGFPFVFSESLSVNTPVLLARSAAVDEVFPVGGVADAFVYRRDIPPQMLARLINEALSNRECLLQTQLRIDAQMRSRSWRNVAEEYLAVCRAAADEK